MNEIKIFENTEFGSIRTLEENGRVLFGASDIAKALGYVRPNDAISAHCKATVKRSTPISGKLQEINYIPEGDVYRLIIRSKLPSAEKFEKWVFDEVLPSIRKHGMYATDELLNNPDFAIKAFTALKEEREKRKSLEVEVAQQKQIIGELKPKSDYTDKILNNKGLVTISQIAKDYGMSGRKMNNLLHEFGIQYKQSGQWLLYAKYHDKGYTHSKTINITRTDGSPDVTMETKWTQKGRLFIYELLKSKDILPLVEQEKSA